VSTVSLPAISDGYWNFGWAGVGLLGAIAGFSWGLGANFWKRGHLGLCWIALALFTSCNVASPFFALVVATPLTVLVVSATVWALAIAVAAISGTTRRSRASPTES
jgi:hypothetical protein